MAISKRIQNAETAYQMAVRKVGYENLTADRAGQMWEECHANEELLSLVGSYIYSTPSYAPRAFEKIQEKLEECFGTYERRN